MSINTEEVVTISIFAEFVNRFGTAGALCLWRPIEHLMFHTATRPVFASEYGMHLVPDDGLREIQAGRFEVSAR